MKKRVAIIGAGITGLTTAWYLKKSGVDVTVFDRNAHCGGVIRTTRHDGFVYENGPNSGTLSSPEAVELIEDMADLCELEIADESSKFRWILKDGRWTALPAGLIGGIRTPLFTWGDKFRLLGEPWRKAGTNPEESLADLVRRRMGHSFLRYAIDPFVLGVYAGDPEKLLTRYAFPKLYNLEQRYGSFIGGSIRKMREPKTDREKRATKQIFSIRGGLSNLLDAMAAKIGREHICLNTNELAVMPAANGYTVSGVNVPPQTFTHAVSTVGGYAIRALLPFLAASAVADIERMKYAGVVQASVGFRQWEGVGLQAFGGLIPSVERRDILGALFMSSQFSGRAPERGALLSVFIGGIRHPELAALNDVQIQALLESEFRALFGLKRWMPDLLVLNRYTHAIPQYGAESGARLRSIAAVESAYPALYLAGHIRDGIGISDRIKQGRATAEKIINSGVAVSVNSAL
ncbi:MAG: protoporphyrinogen oxidase [Bacteroidales bacterium]|jgi:oxygen-dependent protoporphyrinogen oxidase|nr:protoporphyrinogen oxidase [Bacteroidales bacterium]